MCIIKLGTWIEGIINTLTFGRGKDIASWIAVKLGYTDCGCDRRREYLDTLSGCPPGIKLE
jgi:hypothetical protein